MSEDSMSVTSVNDDAPTTRSPIKLSASLTSTASRIEAPECLRSSLNMLQFSFQDYLEREQELLIERFQDYLDRAQAWDDSELDCTCSELHNLASKYWTSFRQGQLFDTMPVYDVLFHLLRHPDTGILHSSNTLELSVDVFGPMNEVKKQTVYAELIGGNFPLEEKKTAEQSADELQDGEEDQQEKTEQADAERKENECTLRLRIWTKDDSENIFFASAFWSLCGLIVAEDGNQVSIHNVGCPDPVRDTTANHRCQDGVYQLPEHHRLQGCEELGGCSAFILPQGSLPGIFKQNFEFTLPDDQAYEQADAAVWCLRILFKRRFCAAEIRKLILLHLFKYDVLEHYCIAGTLAIAVGVGPLREERDDVSDEEEGESEEEEAGECVICGAPAVSWTGGTECASCFDEH